ncbi:MAG TPA: glycerophosphoryl diester phosphodiesterase [Arenibaculum sp.]|nr:glycerophosphoryl diester phosphodiesterase [Arenibaculum sp.]
MLSLPPVIGHRGARNHAPENTLAGIREAHRQGARWVEVDVKLTRDGHPVLMHDATLERTTNGRGPVRERDLDEILRLDAGAWFSPGFAGERVPMLEQALALCAELGLGINLEIKPCPGRAAETARVAIERAGPLWAGRPVLVSSFEHECLEEVLRRAPDWPTGFLFEGRPGDWRETARRLGVATLNVEGASDRHAIREYVDFGLPVLTWTVNDVARARELLAFGVASVITDEPGTMLSALAG